MFSQGNVLKNTLLSLPDMGEVTLARRTLYEWEESVSLTVILNYSIRGFIILLAALSVKTLNIPVKMFKEWREHVLLAPVKYNQLSIILVIHFIMCQLYTATAVITISLINPQCARTRGFLVSYYYFHLIYLYYKKAISIGREIRT